MTGRRLEMVQVDVFTARALEGNPLAVFTDARGLGPAEMQAIARETNLSETTFVFPGDAAVERERGVRVRIFTVDEEVPFAGHPTLGTAFVLRSGRDPAQVRLDLDAGSIPVRFEERPGEPPFGEMHQVDPVFGRRHQRPEVARALGVAEDALEADLPIETVSTGLPFTIVPFRSLARLQGLQLDWWSASRYLASSGGGLFYCICRETVDRSARIHARMVFYGGEDPATGSAAGCAAAWLVAHGVVPSDEPVIIEQGLEIGRPSRIHVRATRVGDRVTGVRVGGQVVEVMRGVYLA